MTERRSGEDRRSEDRGTPERRKAGRPREFDGDPIAVRLPADLHDAISRHALRNDQSVSDVIRKRLAAAFRIPKPTDPTTSS
jgi:hypothetical protein